MRVKRKPLVVAASIGGGLYLLLFLGSLTDKWTPFEDHLPYSLFDSPLDAFFYPPKRARHVYISFEKWPPERQFSRVQNSSTPCGMPELVGPIKVWMDEPSTEQLLKMYPNVESGGHGYPKNCQSRDRVAIIVPYRDRESQLKIFLHNMHSFLSKQGLDYGIFVVEQVGNQTFNRAKLINVGFVQALKYYDWDCFVFHDVDMLPEDDRNFYKCPKKPRHMSVALDKFDYELPYFTYFGGITAFTRDQMESINGYSNDYWGWGGEDDEALRRVWYVGYTVTRYPAEIARYKMIKHEHEGSNPVNACRFRLMKRTRRRMGFDGLSNLVYKLLSSEKTPLYTRIHVDLLEAESKIRLRQERPSLSIC